MGGPTGGNMGMGSMGGGAMGGPTQAPPNPATGLNTQPMGGPTPSGGGPMQPTPSMTPANSYQPSPALSGTGQSPQPQMSNPMPAPPAPQPAQPVNGVSNQTPPIGVRNQMTVHNPTGIGANTASQVAATTRPIPATYPKKKVGQTTPMPPVTQG